MINVIAKSVVKADQKGQFLELARELIAHTRKEKGCLGYALYEGEDPDTYFFIESWQDRACLETHFQSEHFKRIVPRFADMRRESRVELCRPYGAAAALQSVLCRRSIRKFSAVRDIADETVDIVLRAAMQAPSAANQQPWRFIVVRDRNRLEAISRVSPYAAMTRDAALAVVIAGDIRAATLPAFWPQDCAAATQNLLLEAVNQGLGAVWLGVHPVKDREVYLARMLELPEGVIPFAVVPVGYPEQPNVFVERWDPDKVHRERW